MAFRVLPVVGVDGEGETAGEGVVEDQVVLLRADDVADVAFLGDPQSWHAGAAAAIDPGNRGRMPKGKTGVAGLGQVGLEPSGAAGRGGSGPTRTSPARSRLSPRRTFSTRRPGHQAGPRRGRRR